MAAKTPLRRADWRIPDPVRARPYTRDPSMIASEPVALIGMATPRSRNCTARNINAESLGSGQGARVFHAGVGASLSDNDAWSGIELKESH